MKKLLSGNEAIARGAYEAGVGIAAAYPGTPSTEILENTSKYKEIYAEWSVNEKVAFEIAYGGAVGGKRSLAAMKHVGVNVASDALMTAAYTGINAGLVFISGTSPLLAVGPPAGNSRHCRLSSGVVASHTAYHCFRLPKEPVRKLNVKLKGQVFYD